MGKKPTISRDPTSACNIIRSQDQQNIFDTNVYTYVVAYYAFKFSITIYEKRSA